MTWTAPFIVYRIDQDLTLMEVYYPRDFKAANYWLKFIAQPGDVCCRTPAHPKHSTKAGKPEYFSHKESSGTTLQNAEDWWKIAKERGFDGEFPEEQYGSGE